MPSYLNKIMNIKIVCQYQEYENHLQSHHYYNLMFLFETSFLFKTIVYSFSTEIHLNMSSLLLYFIFYIQ